ncbi:MAG: DUF6503 family protein [Bacteroidota bacterium]
MKILIFLISLLVLAACTATNLSNAEDKAQFIVDQAIEHHGGIAYQSMNIKYQFRDKMYTIANNENKYTYTRSFHKNDRQIEDQLNNNGAFLRKVNGTIVELPDSMSNKYANSTNSVNYFAQLPYHLNDAAVYKSYEGEANIKGKKYQVVKVTFAEEGGGDDFDDTYYYWFDAENYQLDYLAYNFHVNGGGVRFRSAYNSRAINNIRFQDYINYKAPKHTELAKLPELLEAGRLEELSRIELKDIKFLK